MRVPNTYTLPETETGVLTTLCQWHSLVEVYTASMANTDGEELGTVLVGNKTWETSLSTVHSYSLYRALQLTNGPDIVKFRAHAYPTHEYGRTALEGQIVAIGRKSGSAPRDFADSAPNISQLRVTHRSLGHVTVRSNPIFKDKAGPEVMAIESQGNMFAVDETLELIRNMGGKLVELVNPDATHNPYEFNMHYHE